MFDRHARLLLTGCLVALTACSTAVKSGRSEIGAAISSPDAGASNTDDARPSTTATPAGESPTTTTLRELDVYDPQCVVVIAPGESLSLIADRFDDDTVNVATIRAENDIEGDTIHPGDQLDVCVDNGLDDVTGEARTEPNAAIVAAATRANVEVQQRKLNELFAAYGTPELLIDGVSGSVTRQRLCAARLALGLPAATTDMAAGSEEEQVLLAAASLSVPFTSALLSPRWAVIDQTCQMMFVGEGPDRLVFVFPTSTGEPGYETRPQDRTRAFRFDPALDNNGWHDSTDFPVPADNPLNGNMYRPLYFDSGQAIHGANNVPTNPQSKGCARLRVEHQDQLIGWLGLADAVGPTNDSNLINLTVNVQGVYVPA